MDSTKTGLGEVQVLAGCLLCWENRKCPQLVGRGFLIRVESKRGGGVCAGCKLAAVLVTQLAFGGRPASTAGGPFFRVTIFYSWPAIGSTGAHHSPCRSGSFPRGPWIALRARSGLLGHYRPPFSRFVCCLLLAEGQTQKSTGDRPRPFNPENQNNGGGRVVKRDQNNGLKFPSGKKGPGRGPRQ